MSLMTPYGENHVTVYLVSMFIWGFLDARRHLTSKISIISEHFYLHDLKITDSEFQGFILNKPKDLNLLSCIIILLQNQFF